MLMILSDSRMEQRRIDLIVDERRAERPRRAVTQGTDSARRKSPRSISGVRMVWLEVGTSECSS